MNNAIGIRREDKYAWERRAPLTPEQVTRLVREHCMKVYVQPSPVRVFSEEAYRQAGAIVQEDLSPCDVILAVKEVPLDAFLPGRTYFFFSHTIKGQPYNMPMLKRMMEKKCQLVDYERIVDEQGRRLVLFGRHAGLSGMIESLRALGLRLSVEGVPEAENPFLELRQPYQYRDLEEAKAAVRTVGDRIRERGLPAAISPCVVGLLGYGNVSRGAQEILECLPVEELSPEALRTFDRARASANTLHKVVFQERHMVEPRAGGPFILEDYYRHPEKYEAIFAAKYLQHVTVLVNGVYWDDRYPVLVSADDIKGLFSKPARPALRVIGDITCDIEGSIAVTRKGTLPDTPCFVYDPSRDVIEDGVANLAGPVIMAVDILPTEFPVESSAHFGESLLPFLPAVAEADFSEDYEACRLPAPIKAALILHHGKLTEPYDYMGKFVK